jgi:hypothetical protein
MFKKELLALCKPFPNNIFYDWWMSMHAAATGTIGCISQTLTWHREHESNSSRELMFINEKEERNAQLRKQMVYFLETFCNRNLLKQEQKDALLQYAALLKNLNGKKIFRDHVYICVEEQEDHLSL